MKWLLILFIDSISKLLGLLKPGGVRSIMAENILLKQQLIILMRSRKKSRKIVGFAAHKGSLNGVSICHMFDRILVGKQSPKYLSTDNDPLFKFKRWDANLRIADIEALKSVPSSPTSPPFIERKIGSIRREFTDHILFWTKSDVEAKLNCYRNYFNNFRVHEAHQGKTPSEKDENRTLGSINLGAFQWKTVCGSLYQTPITA